MFTTTASLFSTSATLSSGGPPSPGGSDDAEDRDTIELRTLRGDPGTRAGSASTPSDSLAASLSWTSPKPVVPATPRIVPLGWGGSGKTGPDGLAPGKPPPGKAPAGLPTAQVTAVDFMSGTSTGKGQEATEDGEEPGRGVLIHHFAPAALRPPSSPGTKEWSLPLRDDKGDSALADGRHSSLEASEALYVELRDGTWLKGRQLGSFRDPKSQRLFAYVQPGVRDRPGMHATFNHPDVAWPILHALKDKATLTVDRLTVYAVPEERLSASWPPVPGARRFDSGPASAPTGDDVPGLASASSDDDVPGLASASSDDDIPGLASASDEDGVPRRAADSPDRDRKADRAPKARRRQVWFADEFDKSSSHSALRAEERQPARERLKKDLEATVRFHATRASGLGFGSAARRHGIRLRDQAAHQLSITRSERLFARLPRISRLGKFLSRELAVVPVQYLRLGEQNLYVYVRPRLWADSAAVDRDLEALKEAARQAGVDHELGKAWLRDVDDGLGKAVAFPAQLLRAPGRFDRLP